VSAVLQLMLDVERLGAHLTAASPDKVKVSGKPLPAELIEQLRAHRAELLSLVVRQEALVASWTEQERRDRFEERAAILEYDEGLSRVEAERLAKAHLSQEEGTTK
jgi:hypothetical protein